MRAVAIIAALIFSGGDNTVLRDRIADSIRAGTGGEVAAFARCNIDAVIDFQDGHLDSGSIKNGRLLWYLFLEKKAPGPPGLSKAGHQLLEAERSRLQEHHMNFLRVSKSYARKINQSVDDAEAESNRRTSVEASNEAQLDSLELADRSIATLRRQLRVQDRKVFERWLEDHRASAVILQLDWSKVTNYECSGY